MKKFLLFQLPTNILFLLALSFVLLVASQTFLGLFLPLFVVLLMIAPIIYFFFRWEKIVAVTDYPPLLLRILFLAYGLYFVDRGISIFRDTNLDFDSGFYLVSFAFLLFLIKPLSLKKVIFINGRPFRWRLNSLIITFSDWKYHKKTLLKENRDWCFKFAIELAPSTRYILVTPSEIESAFLEAEAEIDRRIETDGKPFSYCFETLCFHHKLMTHVSLIAVKRRLTLH